MSKKEIESNPLSNAIREIKKTNNENKIISSNSDIVDIITFCDNPKYLDLPGENNNFNLYISQRAILKCFYTGTTGNENLKLDQKEWDWLYNKKEKEEIDGIEYNKNIDDVIKKMYRREHDKTMPYFKELHLALGRRSSKTVLASIITAYEAYKLLVINNGNPHKYYKLPSDDEIAIINVALSQTQSGILFSQIQSRLRNSPFFRGRIAKESSSEIRLYTDSDLQKKRNGTNISIPGSISLLCGHSNPDSLTGHNAILLLFDEIAFYDEKGVVPGSYFYHRLKPSLSKFFKYNAARIVQISSTNTRTGIFYDTWNLAKTDDSILSFQLPTWDVNPEVPYDEPELARDRKKNIEMFASEYGSQWSDTGSYHNYFEKELIENCIKSNLSKHTKPMPQCNYYIHVDPAKKGNNYAAVMIAKQRYTNAYGQKRNRCILAGVWVWRPIPGFGIQFLDVDREILRICDIFHPMSVTYDDYHSMQSIQLLRSHGINTQIISYNRSNKAKMYQNLREMMGYKPEPELYLYDDGGDSSLLVSELLSLKLKQNQRGYAIIPDKNGNVNTDDLADALAGACTVANEGLRMGLPEPVVVKTGWI